MTQKELVGLAIKGVTLQLESEKSFNELFKIQSGGEDSPAAIAKIKRLELQFDELMQMAAELVKEGFQAAAAICLTIGSK